jgi:hypothetical protein
VLDTPSRRDFWFGHGFVLDAQPGDPHDGPVALYRRLGFVPASHLDAVIVPVVPCSTGPV